MTSVIFALIGLLVFGIAWADKSWIPNPDGAGEWRSWPVALRPFVKRGDGPVLVGAVFGELAGLVTFGVGMYVALGMATLPLSAIAVDVLVGAWVLALASFGAVGIRGWRRRRRDDSPRH